MTNEQHEYDQVRDYSYEEVQAAIQEDDWRELSKAVIGVSMYASDSQYAEGLCISLAMHRNSKVRGNAVLGFGHLARRFGQLKASRAKGIIESALQDDSEYVRGQAWAAAEDVTHFLGWEIAGFDEEGYGLNS